MSIEAMHYVWSKSKTKGAQRLMLLAIADAANDDGVCYPGVGTLAKKVNTTERNAQKLIHALANTGEIIIEEGKGLKTTHGWTNRYTMTFRGVSKLTPHAEGVSELTPQGVNVPTPQEVSKLTPKPKEYPKEEPKEREEAPAQSEPLAKPNEPALSPSKTEEPNILHIDPSPTDAPKSPAIPPGAPATVEAGLGIVKRPPSKVMPAVKHPELVAPMRRAIMDAFDYDEDTLNESAADEIAAVARELSDTKVPLEVGIVAHAVAEMKRMEWQGCSHNTIKKHLPTFLRTYKKPTAPTPGARTEGQNYFLGYDDNGDALYGEKVS